MEGFETYEERKIDKYEKDGIMVSTVKLYRISNREMFETMICGVTAEDKDDLFEEYFSEEDAINGHKRWVSIVTSDDRDQIINKLIEQGV